MSSSAALLQFAAEFVVFLAASAGVGSVLAGADGDGGRRSLSRAAAATGFVALAVSAVVRGSDVAGGSDTAQVVGLRAAGVVLLFLESVRSPLRRPARIALWAGLALLVAAGGADVADEATATGVMLAVGGAVVGLSVVLAGQRSIATRVSTSAAGIVLVVVLILGLSLSVVLVSTVQDGVVERLERRAGNEAANAQAAATQLAGAARVVSGSLGGALIDTVARLADQQVASDRLAEPLATLSENFLENASLAFVSRRGAAQGAVNFTTAELVSLSGSDVVREALTTGDTRNAVEVVAGSAQAIRVQPVPLGGRPPLLGVAVAAIPLDRTYLERAARDDRDLALALVTPERTLSSFGPTVAPVLFRAMVAQALERGVMSGTVGDRFVSVAPVDRGDGTSAVALVASYPTTLVADTRDELFRVLFLIALAGTVIALTLASLVGSRIGSRLQLLTEAARSIRRGDPVPRTGITTDDEVGVLSVTFDAMARAVAEKTAAESALRNRLEAVVAGMGEALVVVDAAGMVTDFNPAAEELFGLMASDAAGRPVDEVVHLTDDDGRSLVYDLRAPDRWSARGMVETVDGVRVPVAISVGTLGLGVLGRGGRVVNLRDLRGEQQVERMKTELLARFSHEYRTPLTP
ncbi:MAG: PAS domain S-box protein, partial [Acidimicrobiales bacterium]